MEMLECLFEMALQGSLAIVIVLFIRKVMPRLPKKYVCILWYIAAIRLLCPFVPEGPFPALWSEEQKQAVIGKLFVTGENNGFMVLGLRLRILLDVWCVGTCIAMLAVIVCYASAARKLHAAKRAGSWNGLELWEKDLPFLPAAFGIFRMRVFVPEGFLTELTEEKEYILWHEKMHLARWDTRGKFFLYLVLCLYWWNPLCWAMAREAEKDMEMACDEAVLKSLGEASKTEYAGVLLSYEVQQNELNFPVFFGESNTTQRVRHVLKYKRNTK